MRNCFGFGICFLLISLWSGCAEPENEKAFQYLFMGHIYDWNQGNRVDPRLESADFSRFDQVWLGGDICSRTTEEPGTLDYLDSLFDLCSSRTQWTLGNHDLLFGHQDRIETYTGRPTFYAAWINGICLVVLNTNYFWYYPSTPAQDNCAAKSRQLELIRSVCDTIQQASHLVILHHHALLAGLITDRGGQQIKAFNANYPDPAVTCDSASLFTETVYPMLTAVQNKGIQVIMVGGDLGTKAKKFSYRTAEGVVLLGAGLNNSLDPRYAPEYVTSFDPDQVLIFHHDPQAGRLDWSFITPEALPKK